MLSILLYLQLSSSKMMKVIYRYAEWFCITIGELHSCIKACFHQAHSIFIKYALYFLPQDLFSHFHVCMIPYFQLQILIRWCLSTSSKSSILLNTLITFCRFSQVSSPTHHSSYAKGKKIKCICHTICVK